MDRLLPYKAYFPEKAKPPYKADDSLGLKWELRAKKLVVKEKKCRKNQKKRVRIIDPAKRPVFINNYRKRIGIVKEIVSVIKPVKVIGVDNENDEDR